MCFYRIGNAYRPSAESRLIQIIYEFDIHSVLNKKWHILAAGAAAAAIFSAVYFDFTGYDTYIPETDEIASVAFTFRQDIYGFSNYERLFEKNIYYSNHEEYMLSHMDLRIPGRLKRSGPWLPEIMKRKWI